MQWAGKQLKRLFQPKPAEEVSPRRPAAEAHPQESRSKEQLKEEAVRLKSQLDALTAGLEVSVVNGTWVQRFIDLHQQHLEIGCRLEDGTVNVQAEVRRLQNVLSHSKVVAALDKPGLYRGRTGHLGPDPVQRRTEVLSYGLDEDSDEALPGGHKRQEHPAARTDSQQAHDDLERTYDAFDSFRTPGEARKFQPPKRNTSQAEEERQARDAEEAAARKAEEDRLAKEEAARKEEEERQAREAEEAAARKAEEDRLAKEEAARKEEEERQAREAEEAAARKAEEDRLAKEQAARKEEEERQAREAGEAAARKAEEDRLAKEEEERQAREAEEAAARKAEEDRLAEEQAARKEEEERQAREAEEAAARKAEKERLVREAEEAVPKPPEAAPQAKEKAEEPVEESHGWEVERLAAAIEKTVPEAMDGSQPAQAALEAEEDLLGGPSVSSRPTDWGNAEDLLGISSPSAPTTTMEKDDGGALEPPSAPPQELLQATATSDVPEKSTTLTLESDEEDLLGGTSIANRPLATSADDDLLL